jgi:hypothetical protein
MRLDRATTLPDGLRVRLRLARGTDRGPLAALAARIGEPLGDMALTRLLRHDPCHRTAVCAYAWVDGSEVLVGFAAGDIGAAAPDIVLADPAHGRWPAVVLAEALAERSARARRHVA